MEVYKVKDIELYLNKKKRVLFLYFYEDWCHSLTEIIDSFFRNKYDLNKMYIKVKVSQSKQIIDKLDIETYPIIKVYKCQQLYSQIHCNSNSILQNLESIYNIV